MKAKSGKIIKICALSLGLLMLGGVTITPITKVYADGSGQSTSEEMDRTIRIKYTGDKKFNGAWLWVVGQNGHFVPFKKDDSGNRYIDTTIKCKDGATIGYIICRSEYDEDTKTWSDPKEKDETVKNGTGIDANDRTIVVKGKGIEFSLTEKDTTEPKVTEIQSTIAEKVGDKLKPYVKPIKIWKGGDLEWVNSIDKTKEADDPDVKEALAKIKSIVDSSGRINNGSDQKGKIKVTFNDDSTLEFENTLYVTDHITALNNQNAPADAIEIEFKLGEGVEVIETDGTKYEGPKSYKKYKAKPGVNVNTDKLVSNKTILEYIPAKPTDPKKVVKWINSNKKEEFVVGDDNKVFTAVAEKIPEKPKKEEDKKPGENQKKPEKEKPADTKKKKPNYSDVWNGIKSLEKKSEKKVKPSEKVLKSYKNLIISREKNVVAVKAAKLLLEIAPERVKGVKGTLENLINKSEGLVKQADKILEKLEAKYEF